MQRLSLVLAAALFCPVVQAQTTWYVDANGTPPGTGAQSDPYTDLQFAVDQVTTLDGDEILVQSGFYTTGLDFAGKTLMVRSLGDADFTILTSVGSVVTATSGEGPGTTLVGFTIQGGTGTPEFFQGFPSALRGGGVLVEDSSLVLRECRLQGNSASQGGGALLDGGQLSLIDCQVDSNIASWASGGQVVGAGVACSGGLLTLTRTTVESNFLVAPNTNPFNRRGAGIFSGLLASGIPPALRMIECTVEDNQFADPAQGGGLFLQSNDALIEDCVFEGNATEGAYFNSNAGGGVYAIQNSQVTMRRTRIAGNGAGFIAFGGGYAGPGLLEDCEILDNEALLGGGVASVPGAGSTRPVLVNCLLELNRARSQGIPLARGGGAYESLLTGCTLRANASFGSGGAAERSELTDCVIENNTALSTGAPNAIARGGALSECTATNCWIESNAVTPAASNLTDGGGAAYDSTLVRCVLVDNTVAPPGLGAATRDCSMDRCTVTGSDIPGGFGYTIEGAGLIENTIIWGNNTDFDIDPDGLLPFLDYCNIEEGVFPGRGNLSADPLFWSLANDDLRLRVGSPSIDSGDPAAEPDSDGSVADQGAFAFDPDYCGAPSNYCGAKINSLGCFASMGFEGFPTASGPDDFVLVANDLPLGQFGIPVWSAAPAATPLAGGLLCVASPITRGSVATSGTTASGPCGGARIQFAFPQSLMANLGLVPGTRVYAQFWYRDPNHPDGTGQSLTDGLDFTVCP